MLAGKRERKHKDRHQECKTEGERERKRAESLVFAKLGMSKEEKRDIDRTKQNKMGRNREPGNSSGAKTETSAGVWLSENSPQSPK